MNNKNQQQNPTLRSLRKGEMSTVERKYTIDKNFNFFGSNTIESQDDVAYIFKNLQTASVENFFMVYVTQDNKPIIQHLSMGGPSGTVVPIEFIRDAINRFEPKRAFMVHNHPSGNLMPSEADRKILEKLKELHGEIIEQGIIINTISGYYSLFSEYHTCDIGEQKIPTSPIHPKKVKVYKFDKQVFQEDVKPLSKITSSFDVATFLSQQRLAKKGKYSVLILNRNNQIQANLHLPTSRLTQHNYEKIGDEISSYITRFGGCSAIMYGNNQSLSTEENKKKQQNCIRVIGANLKYEGYQLLDFIHVGSDPTIDIHTTHNYESAADNGILEPKIEYKGKISKEYDLNILFGAPDILSTTEKKTPEELKEEWYQKSHYSKEWAATYVSAVEKTIETYKQAENTYITWSNKEYESSNNESQKDRVNYINNAKIDMDDAIHTLHELQVPSSTIQQLKANTISSNVLNKDGQKSDISIEKENGKTLNF